MGFFVVEATLKKDLSVQDHIYGALQTEGRLEWPGGMAVQGQWVEPVAFRDHLPPYLVNWLVAPRVDCILWNHFKVPHS